MIESKDFKNAITDISSFPSPQTDKLVTLATILLGVWDSLERTNVSLIDIVKAINTTSNVGSNFIVDEPLKIDEKVKMIYDKIPNFKWLNFGSTFYWSYKENMTGEIQKTSYLEFEKAVLKNKPTIYSELESLM